MPSYPTDANVLTLFCESIRDEGNGKTTLLGYLGGNEIKVSPGTVLPGFIPFAVAFVLQDGDGTFHCSLSISDPNGQPVATGPLPDITKTQNNNHMVNVNIPTFKITRTGTYNVDLTLGPTKYHRTFIVKQ
jgi:hypothetical protein